jgi:hypothetical protein
MNAASNPAPRLFHTRDATPYTVNTHRDARRIVMRRVKGRPSMSLTWRMTR